MEQKIEQVHYVDEKGNPMGGHSHLTMDGRALGLEISWQHGPLDPEQVKGETAKEIVDKAASGPCRPNRGRNGAIVEDVIDAAIGRLTFFQNTKFPCRENLSAMHYLRLARKALDTRTLRRRAQGVEGKMEKHVSA